MQDAGFMENQRQETYSRASTKHWEVSNYPEK